MIVFDANTIDTYKQDYTPDYTVFGILLEESDPERGGHSWTFQRALGPDGALETLGEVDEGACLIKEVQQYVVHGAVGRITLGRDLFQAEILGKAAEELGSPAIKVTLCDKSVSWDHFVQMVKIVFQGLPIILEEKS